MRENRTAAFLLAHLLALAVPLLAADGPPALPADLKLYCAFEEGLHSCQGAANPFSAAGFVKLTPGGKGRGQAVHFRGHMGFGTSQRSAMLFDGANLPVERGTVGLWLRCSGQRTWRDGTRTWLMVLTPQVGECLSISTDNGTGLALYKDKDDALVLGAYQFHGRRLTPDFRSSKSGFDVAEPDSIVARIPVGDLPKREWTPIRVAWDRPAGKAWLGVGKTLRSGAVTYRRARWLCLLLGTPPSVRFNKAVGFDGDVDDLCVDVRTPAQAANAGFEVPKPAPAMARPQGAQVEAVCLKSDPLGAQLERIVRAHMGNVMQTQEEHGGWTFSAAWPSGLWILSSGVVIPYTHDLFNGSKDGNSAACAMRLLNGYYTLDDKQYVEAAEKTAATLLRLQSPKGCWPYTAIHDPDADAFEVTRPDIAFLQDHVQAHPTLLLMLLHKITGKAKYESAAQKGLAFMLRTQNPNGSWSHHWNNTLDVGEAAQRKYKNAGETNDDATQDQMGMMLAAYRMTGDVKYLASFLRAADWLRSAFIDKKAKGWAQQYDENNNPIPARHFEPPAVSLSEGAHSIPRTLIQAYRLTGDMSYLEPCDKWRQWMLDNRVFTNQDKTQWGWHTYYDPETGEPYRMTKRKRLPVDPRSVREGGYTGVLREVAAAAKPLRTRPTAQEYARRCRATEASAKERYGDDAAGRLRLYPLARMFNWDAGTWLFAEESPTGPKFSPSTIRVGLVSYIVMLRRQLAGQIPWDHPVSQMSRVQWAGNMSHLIPPHEMAKPLTRDELQRARGHIASLRRDGKAK